MFVFCRSKIVTEVVKKGYAVEILGQDEYNILDVSRLGVKSEGISGRLQKDGNEAMRSRAIQNKALVYELFDLLCEIEDSADFCADIAEFFDDEEDFRDMIDWLKDNRGIATYKDTMMHAVLIHQRNLPDDFFEEENQ